MAGQAGAHERHTVQFYEGKPFLYRAIERFLAHARLRREPAVLIARPETFEAVTRGMSTSRLRFLDVDTALQGFMKDGMPDPARVEQAFTNLLGEMRLSEPHGTIWIYGEMVDVLCRQGNHAAAIRLEQLWNERFMNCGVSVLCGYGIDNFDHDAQAQQLKDVCTQHSHIVPTETFIDAPDDRTRCEQVVVLQQIARALDRVMTHEPPRDTTER